MTKKIIKIVSAIICVAFIASAMAILTSAADYRAGNNDISDSYAASEYYKRFKKAPITGDGPTDAIAIALSQIGYQESDTDGEYSGMVAGKNNFTEFNYNMGDYGSGYGGDYYWCASFVSFCLYQGQCHDLGKISDWCRKNEGKEGYVWREVGCQKWVDQLRKFRLFKAAPAYSGTYVPQAGDLVFFSSNGKTSSHIGIVLYTDSERVYTIEGNTSSGTGLDSNGGGVYFKNYEFGSTYILGYGVLPYERNENVTLIDYSGANPTEGLYVSTTDKPIYANAGDSEVAYRLPKYSMFEVTEVVSTEVLKGKFTIDGVKVEGYIANDARRIIQLSNNANEDLSDVYDGEIVEAEEAKSFVKKCVDSYFIGETATAKDALNLTNLDKLSIYGWIGFESEIESFGYAIDGLDAPVFDASFTAQTEDAVTSEANAGEYGKRFSITVDMTSVEVGEHTVNFLVKLANGRTYIIDTATIVVAEAEISGGDNSGNQGENNSTEETTEALTEENTTVNNTTENDTASETDGTSEEESTTAAAAKKKGCKSTASALSAIMLLGVAAFAAKKKKED